MQSKIILTVVIITALAVGVFYLINDRSNQKNLPHSTEFVGSINSVEGNTLKLRGYFLTTNSSPGTVAQQTDVTVTVDEKTKFHKTILQLPDQKTLDANNGLYKPDELPKQEVEGNIEDLKSGEVGDLSAKSEEDIYGKDSFRASQISYVIVIR